jgi:hypothetical protein
MSTGKTARTFSRFRLLPIWPILKAMRYFGVEETSEVLPAATVNRE